MRAKQFDTGAPEIVERSCIGGDQERERRLERSRLEAQLGGRQCPLRSSRGIQRQRDCALEKRSRCGESASSLRTPRRALKLCSYFFARACSGGRSVPG